MNINVTSEIGKLNGVVIHLLGTEIENMTPQHAEKALYSDILNLSVAREEYLQFQGVLQKVTKTFEAKDLLLEVLKDDKAKQELIEKICTIENENRIIAHLFSLPPKELTRQLIEGVPLEKNKYSNFLSEERFSLQPLHNFFFMRDSAVAINNKILISQHANQVRKRESLILETIFQYSRYLRAETVDPRESPDFIASLTIEGGDVFVLRDDILLIGNGCRTSAEGIDYIIEQLKVEHKQMHIVVQQLPHSPESFIHLDMVFTMLDKDQCMIFEPWLKQSHKYRTVHITVDNGKVTNITEEKNLLAALKELGMDLEPLYCGGNDDLWVQEREQWHSGTNFFAVAPGKVIGYRRNVYTIEEMNKHGYEIIDAQDVIDEKINIDDFNKCTITISGAELARGDGGCRCMSMPINRDNV